MTDQEKKDGGADVQHLIETFLQCGVCNLYFNEDEAQPKLLPCLHTYCNSCIKKMSEGKCEIECPKCLTIHAVQDEVTVFPKDNARQGLMDFIKVNNSRSDIVCQSCDEKLPAMYRCKECSEFLCEDCYAYHKRTIKLKSHSLLSLKDYEYSLQNAKEYMNYDYCLVHGNEKLDLYCTKEECGMPVCRICAETTHNHGKSSPVSIKTVYDKKKEELQLHSFELEKKIQEAKIRITDVEKEMAKIPTDSDKIKEDVRGSIEACMELLYKRANELHQEVDKIQLFKLQILNGQKQELVKNKALLEDGQQFLQQAMTYSNVPAFLQIVPTIAKQLVLLGNNSTQAGPIVKSDLFFSTQGLGKDFQNHILSMGKIMTKTIHPASCRASIHGDVNKGQGLRIAVTLKDYEGNIIQDKFIKVVMKVSDSEGDTRSEDCLLCDSGTYEATFNLVKYGRHGIVILAAGQPIKTLSVERAVTEDYNKLSSLTTATKNNRSPTSDNSIEVNTSQSTTNTTKQQVDSCSMCGDVATKNASKLPCGHVFGRECIDEVFKYGSTCPICGNAHETLYGDQPDGTMKIRVFPQTRLPGFEEFGTIEVMYDFPSGIQGDGQPRPGEWYDGLTRRGYLPDNEEGRLLARLLREAFFRRVVFTFKESKSGKYVVTWNNIYHKTRTHGGPKRHGYPDKVYLDRVKQDLAYNGITEECLN